ncbi:1-aminocyclopropane-1-carboxylate deaminase/D-cysteine desulfhydrase [Yinghuangia seranimata]|uniref:1-aminocyclopropane-1-carboxylate deaminase/D-cysteine desulfhydrase n=1 Tax=Yinghuangia seranimata TaxID=408067 RepID=UPI00248C71B8|nr:pyridoxal-phosphate dependent enzyme [Yinghuangia seranimata]MDI2130407.1 pyridoxal-phosphate dependent enzyme [Yinghuangia seranimata]
MPVSLPPPRVPSPLTELRDDRFAARGLRLWLKRDDLIHPELPGNKWRKLKYNLAAARAGGHGTLLTFGGAYSNHLRATAAAGALYGFATIGVVRGEELAGRPLNPSLAYCAERGMRLVFVDRTTYRRRTDPGLAAELSAAQGPFLLIPEGGSNPAAVRGCAELPAEIDVPHDVVAVACGTGGTLAGIAAGLGAGRRALGIAVLKGGFLPAEVAALQRRTYGAPSGNWHVADGFHHGGYARTSEELQAFLADFEHRHAVALDEVYVGKLLFALTTLAERGVFAPGTGIVAVKTG